MAFARDLSAAGEWWDSAHQAWYFSEECDHLDEENTSEFFRMWLTCVLYGAILCTVIFVPYILCSDRKDPEFEEEKRESALQLEQQQSGQVDAKVGETKDPNSRFFRRAATTHIAKEINFEKAKQHLKDTSPLDAKGRWRPVWKTKASQMSEVGGIGTELYFRLVRVLGFCFALKTIFSLPVLAFSLQGNFVPNIGNSLAASTIGNLGEIDTTGTIPQSDRLVLLGCQGVELKKIAPIFAWLDFAGTLMFTCCVLYFRFRFLPAAVKKDDRENITCKDFTVEIDYLPREIPEQETYEAQLAEHFLGRIIQARKDDKLGSKTVADPQIAEISLVRDFEELLSAVKYRNALAEQQRIAEDKGEELLVPRFLCCWKRPIQYYIDKQDEMLRKQLKSQEQLPVLRAFMILNSPADTARLLMMYRFSKWGLFRRCQSRALSFHGHSIHVKRAPEPTNILWENQDVPWTKRLVLKTVLFLIWLIVIIIAIGLVFAVQKGAKSLGTKAATQVIGTDSTCDAGINMAGESYICNATLAATWTQDLVMNMTNPYREDKIACYCTSVGYDVIIAEQTLWNGLCKDWLLKVTQTIALGIASSIITVVINMVLLQLILWMADREEHTSISAMHTSIMFKVTWSQYGNISLIVFLIHFYLQPFDFILNGEYSDFGRGWYATVGGTLVLNMLFNAITNPILNIVYWWLAILFRCGCCTRRIKHQAELIQVYTNPEFDIAARYAGILVTVLGTLTYSAGLPMLNFFAALYFFLTFWSDKWVLLHGSKRPPLYDSEMPKQCCELLTISLPIHVFVAMLMFSHVCTFPSDPLGGTLGSLADEGKGAVQIPEDANSFSNRISQETSWMFFVLGLILLSGLALWLVLLILGSTVGAVGKACLACCCPKREATLPETEHELTWETAYPHIHRLRPPASYKMENVPGLRLKDILMQSESSGKGKDADNLDAVMPVAAE